MSIQLGSEDLPGFWRDADAASQVGQKWSLRNVRARLLGGLLAATGGAVISAVELRPRGVDLIALLIVIGFAIALTSEVLAWSHQPEKHWYEARALAESAKTLAWRYAVGAEPFPTTLPTDQAHELLRSRLRDVSDGADTGVAVISANAIVTDAMERLRQQPFAVRRAAYLDGRTIEQQRWYATRAKSNQAAATVWRILLVVTEIVAVVLASLRVFTQWEVDLAGILAAVIASGAAWVAVKQYAPLAAAYSTAARELAIQADRLRSVSEDEWATVVANAEKAISREHTLWVASRTGRRAIT